MSYSLVKTFHLVAVCVWIPGMVSQSWWISTRGPVAPMLEAAGAATLHSVLVRWGLWVTTGAMVATWSCGLVLTTSGGWFGAEWLAVKLTVVVLLSALQIAQVTTLYRSSSAPLRSAVETLSFYGAPVILGAFAIGILAWKKPFP